VFPVEGNLTATKSKARLQARQKGRQTDIKLPKTVPRSTRPPLERLLFAGTKAASDPDIPEECLNQIATEVEKQVLLLERSRQTSLRRVTALQEEKASLRDRVVELAAKRNAVRQRYLQKKTAQFDDQSRKSDENIGLDNDIDCTIELLKQEIEVVSDEVAYLRDAFGHLEGIGEEFDTFEQPPETEDIPTEPAAAPLVDEEEDGNEGGELITFHE
jgi:hypothetical protein